MDYRAAPIAHNTPAAQLTAKLDSQTAKEARALFDDYQTRLQYVTDLRSEHEQAVAAFDAARSAHDAAYRDDAKALGDGRIVAEAKAAVTSADERRNVLLKRIHAAEEEERAAHSTYATYLTDNAPELITELTGHGDAVAAKYAQLQADFDRKADSLRKEWAEIRSSAVSVLGRHREIQAEDFPAFGDFTVSPVPDPAVLERPQTLTP